MFVMFIIGAATCLAAVLSIYLAVLHVVDGTHTFMADRWGPLTARGSRHGLGTPAIAYMGIGTHHCSSHANACT